MRKDLRSELKRGLGRSGQEHTVETGKKLFELLKRIDRNFPRFRLGEVVRKREGIVMRKAGSELRLGMTEKNGTCNGPT